MRKIALVTGASRGIGYAAAAKFAKNGYDVIATCLNHKEGLIKLQKSAASSGAFVEPFVCDHADFDTAEKLIKHIENNYGRLDVLINNAGIACFGVIQDLTKEEWERVWNVNVTSVVSMCKAAVALMLKRKKGKIINISSVWGITGASCECAYSATKGAVNSFTKALAKELAPSGIQVNAIACGLIETDMNSRLSEEEIRALCEEIPARRAGNPGEIGEIALMLANAGPYITGQVISADGGWI